MLKKKFKVIEVDKCLIFINDISRIQIVVLDIHIYLKNSDRKFIMKFKSWIEVKSYFLKLKRKINES